MTIAKIFDTKNNVETAKWTIAILITIVPFFLAAASPGNGTPDTPETENTPIAKVKVEVKHNIKSGIWSVPARMEEPNPVYREEAEAPATAFQTKRNAKSSVWKVTSRKEDQGDSSVNAATSSANKAKTRRNRKSGIWTVPSRK